MYTARIIILLASCFSAYGHHDHHHHSSLAEEELLYVGGVRSDMQCPVIYEQTDDEVLLPHDTDCEKFYICTNDGPQLMTCPDHLLFSATKRVCDHPENVTCHTRHPQESDSSSSSEEAVASTTTTQKPTTTHKPSSTTTQKTTTTHKPSTTTTQSPEESDSDEDLLEGSGDPEDGHHSAELHENGCPVHQRIAFIRHETSCRLYYKCVRGRKILKSCRWTLHFSFLWKKCTLPSLAQCEFNQ